MPIQDELLRWSLPLGRVAGIRIWAHWSLLLIMILDLRRVLHWMDWWWLPVLLVIPVVSILLHEFGHALMARLVGGTSDTIVMWMLGGYALHRTPDTWGRQFIVAAAGPFVTFSIMAVCGLLTGIDSGTWWFRFNVERVGLVRDLYLLLAYTGGVNAALLFFNLIPAHPLDGGQMLRSLLRPILGLDRAVITSIWVAFIILPVLLALAVLSSSLLLAMVVVMLFLSVLTEHQAYRHGQLLHHDSPAMEGPSWLDRRRRHQAQARREAEQRKAVVVREAEEQRLRRLDELLEKVSRHGLPSLTEGERAFLRSCSEEERKRSGAQR